MHLVVDDVFVAHLVSESANGVAIAVCMVLCGIF
jgi:hypothetical protein